MNKTESERHINILLEMTECIVDEVSSAELVQIDPQWHNELDAMAFALVFSTGINNYEISITWDGAIINYSKKIPKHLLVDIHNGICAGYLKGIMRELEENNKR